MPNADYDVTGLANKLSKVLENAKKPAATEMCAIIRLLSAELLAMAGGTDDKERIFDGIMLVFKHIAGVVSEMSGHDFAEQIAAHKVEQKLMVN